MSEETKDYTYRKIEVKKKTEYGDIVVTRDRGSDGLCNISLTINNTNGQSQYIVINTLEYGAFYEQAVSDIISMLDKAKENICSIDEIKNK